MLSKLIRRFGNEYLRVLYRNAAGESRQIRKQRNASVRERFECQLHHRILDWWIDLDVSGAVRWLQMSQNALEQRSYNVQAIIPAIKSQTRLSGDLSLKRGHGAGEDVGRIRHDYVELA